MLPLESQTFIAIWTSRHIKYVAVRCPISYAGRLPANLIFDEIAN